MSKACGMVCMMYPDVHKYMPVVVMKMEMGMNRPSVPYPSFFPCPPMPNSVAAAYLGLRFPIPPHHIPAVTLPNPSKIQASDHGDPTLNSIVAHNPNQIHFVDLYMQYLGLHQAQLPLPRPSLISHSLIQASVVKILIYLIDHHLPNI
ncbi:Hypothetical predicted protein [Olea europaea subsp. europaea]|uniref:Uncharacterized protein n=1 Tax=Olea europaea subsp. europaea TaxID=158383 RepID=A0A8S0R1C6_OLEEU|nr:Hypothetical predicted protein [Olea europaea subsp. europaea]